MRNIKTIFILVLSLILFAVSCSNEDKTGETGDGTETIDAKDFPKNLEGTYQDEKVVSAGFSGVNHNTKVSTITDGGIQKTKIEGTWLLIKDDGTKSGQTHTPSIEKWKQTKKGGNPIKLEGEYVKGEEKYTIIYDYASETLIGTYTHSDGTKASFNGKKISKQP